MELRQFVAKTLVDIKNGLRDANELLAKQEGKTLGEDATLVYHIPDGRGDTKSKGIDFDVAVTVTQENASKGGGSINVAVAKIGGKIDESSKEEHISRIKFSVWPWSTVG